MKYALFASTVVALTHILPLVSAQTLTLYQVVDPGEPIDDSLTEDTPIAIPIGTADGGAATTYRIQDPETDTLNDINGQPTATSTFDFTVTVVASASGWKMTEPADVSDSDSSDPSDSDDIWIKPDYQRR
ncbi:hypothetical protein K435DRAFT_355671 [Dendrothele bispora CBS 962.96]|uniref:Cadherin domain-containing protein n=1 Tax=Dendrothele bispora (strain CBS 962.96) TaxID=1314807 RepID=A0A4S8LDQ3_DENBC|nr:hypothetical protein K435DRAFT_355671 [Dendrothele bispora CBS 962.96]